MSSADRVPFILNERYVSPDLNTLQDLWARWLTDAIAYEHAYVDPAVNTSPVGFGAHLQFVLGGLEVSPNGTSILIAEGALIQNLTGGTDDPISEMAIGFNPSAANVATPSPVTDTWCLVQAQVQDVADPTVSVDIWNGSTFVSTPGQVKRRRRTLAFNVKSAGGTPTSIPTLDAGWLPIAALFRPAGGPAVVNSDIVDIRPMAHRPAGTPHDLQDSFYRTAVLDGSPTTIVMNTRVRTAHGDMQFVPNSAAPTAFQPDAPAWKATGSAALAADAWWYLYMCPLVISGLPAIRPRHLYANFKNEGVLVLSDVAPRVHLRDNSATITLPQPFATNTVAAGQATLVGMLRRNVANTGWIPIQCMGNKAQIYDKAIADVGGALPLVLFTAVGTTTLLPAGARAFDVEVSQNVVNASVARLIIEDPTSLVQVTSFLTHDSSVSSSSVFRDVDLTAGQSLRVSAILNGLGTYQATILGFSF